MPLKTKAPAPNIAALALRSTLSKVMNSKTRPNNARTHSRINLTGRAWLNAGDGKCRYT
jgi:hypothetical protein